MKRPSIVVEQGAIHVNAAWLHQFSDDLIRISLDCRAKQFEASQDGLRVYLWRTKETLRAERTPYPTCVEIKPHLRGRWRLAPVESGRYGVWVFLYRHREYGIGHGQIWDDATGATKPKRGAARR